MISNFLQLYLNNNNLTSIDQNMLVRWDKVTTIDLRWNPWNCDCTNHWLIQSLMKEINTTKPVLAKDVKCQAPSIWKDRSLLELAGDKTALDCEGDVAPAASGSLVWIGLLVGILIGIPLTIASLVLYRRGCFGLRNRGRTGDRALYNRAEFSDDFHI